MSLLSLSVTVLENGRVREGGRERDTEREREGEMMMD